MTSQHPTFSLIDELRSILEPQCIYAGDTEDSITLKEDNPKSKCNSVRLRKSERIKTLTLNIDKEGFDAHPLLRAIENLKKHPDYIIFCEDIHTREIYVLIAELKSGDKDDFHRKVRAGIAIVDYLIGMLENYKKRTFKKFQFEYRGLLFYTGVGKEHSDPNFEYDIHPELGYKYTAKPCKGKPLKIFLKFKIAYST